MAPTVTLEPEHVVVLRHRDHTALRARLANREVHDDRSIDAELRAAVRAREIADSVLDVRPTRLRAQRGRGGSLSLDTIADGGRAGFYSASEASPLLMGRSFPIR